VVIRISTHWYCRLLASTEHWWTRQTVESTETAQAISASASAPAGSRAEDVCSRALIVQAMELRVPPVLAGEG
jgi:hypothetical protein